MQAKGEGVRLVLACERRLLQNHALKSICGRRVPVVRTVQDGLVVDPVQYFSHHRSSDLLCDEVQLPMLTYLTQRLIETVLLVCSPLAARKE